MTYLSRVLSTTHKDISLCDVLGTGNDYLFLPYERLLYVLQEPTSVPILITISILTVYMTVKKPSTLWHCGG
jgi:hypothetical protein